MNVEKLQDQALAVENVEDGPNSDSTGCADAALIEKRAKRRQKKVKELQQEYKQNKLANKYNTEKIVEKIVWHIKELNSVPLNSLCHKGQQYFEV